MESAREPPKSPKTKTQTSNYEPTATDNQKPKTNIEGEVSAVIVTVGSSSSRGRFDDLSLVDTDLVS